MGDFFPFDDAGNPKNTGVNMSHYESIKHNQHNQHTIPATLEAGAHMPLYGSLGAAGADLYANIPHPINLDPGCRVLVPTGVCMAIPRGMVGMIRPRSGMALKTGVEAFGGTIDSDYRGEIGVILRNLGQQIGYIEPNQKIAQIVFAPFVSANFLQVVDLDETERGAGGFGSTGK